jgi:hypothetical protein
MDQKPSASAKELELQGWIRQFTVEANRASEYAQLYEELGQEVRVVPAAPNIMRAEECTTCQMTQCDAYVIIYTRKRT